MSSKTEPDFHAALDPVRSVVVEACAGSGKTWLLAARIVRLLLAGAAPGQILAITFTRKAAREIEERVVEWLRHLATAPDTEARAFLAQRGVAVDDAILSSARGLYEQLSRAQPGLAVNTFHGWFLQLVAVAPLSANLAGTQLADDGSRRFDELWQSFARQLQRTPEAPAAKAFVQLLADIGLAGTQALVRQGMARRAEWMAYVASDHDPLVMALQDLQACFGVDPDNGALASFSAGDWAADFHAYLGFLEQSELATDQRLATKLRAALAAGEIAGEVSESCLRAMASALLTDTGTLRVRKASPTLDKRFPSGGAARFLQLHAMLGERLQNCLACLLEERNLAFNRQALSVLLAFLEHLENFKAERRQIDFVDCEWRVRQLLQDEGSAAYMQARLDSRYRHVLLDEFQDTNPLQWQILLAWLAAYDDASRPSVFMVGDPKQSIYRFRRAEPKLFAAAAGFLERHYGALYLTQDSTHRNAHPIIDVVNALFSAEPAFQPFREQRSLAGEVPGRVELLPLFAGDDEADSTEDAAQPSGRLRNPLETPSAVAVDGRRQAEAEALAARLSSMLGQTLIREKKGSDIIERPLRCADVLLLVRKRTQINVYERALAAAGIPFVGASRGGLLDSLEVQDIVALLEFLVTPAADLALAQVLKSPLFACSDEDLLMLAARGDGTWWGHLQGLVAEGKANVRLTRAAALLVSWISAAAALPAHDLLDRVYHQGEVLARYRLAVPEARRAAALANLEALLLLALDIDGGRYPSLSRFTDELRILRKSAADDAPDEGELAADATDSGAGRVRIMTIHGAKGLEAPLVWLLDANAGPRADGAWQVLVDWPPEAAAPTHFSFVGRKDERGLSRAPLFEAEAQAAEREELNLLYVAITRARQIFIASGISTERGGSAATPYSRLETALSALRAEYVYGDLLPECDAERDVQPAFSSDACQPPPTVGERRLPPDAAARFGILLHALLERRTEGRVEEGWWRTLGYSDAELAKAVPVAERLLAAPALQQFFDPACYRRAWNELELSDEQGGLCRLDRLVETEAAFWVLDYKSSGPETARIEEYRAQVAAYCHAVAGIFKSRPVRGALIFADASIVEVSI